MTDANVLSLAFLESQPRAAAALLQEFAPEQIVEFLEEVPVPALVPVFDAMGSWPAARTLAELPSPLAAGILRGLPDAHAEGLLRLMDAGRRTEVMGRLPASVARSFNRKLTYPVSAVGAWMDTSVPYFDTDSSVGHCLDLVKRRQIHLGGIVIVADERRHLVGLVELEKLLTSDTRQPLAQLLNREITPLSPRATLWEVEDHEGWTLFPALPVVDHHNVLLGALTHSALRAGMTRSEGGVQWGGQLSLLLHLGRALLLSFGGLLQVMTGSGQGPAARQRGDA